MSRTLLLAIALVAANGCTKKVKEQSIAPTEKVAASVRQQFDRGVAQMEAGAESYDNAVQSFRAALTQDPRLWEAWLDIGVIELRRARLTEASKALEKSIEIYASPEALDALGEVYLRQDKADRAIELYERALGKDPGDVRLRNALASALRHADRLDAAEAECRAILGDHAFDPTAYATLGAIKIDRGQLDLAELLLQRGLVRHPDHPLLLVNLGLVALRRGDDQTAFAMFDKASAKDPTFVVGRLNKAALFLGAGDHMHARPELDAVLAIEPGNVDALLAQGIALRLAGDQAGARRSWERVLAIDADHAAAHYNLAVLEMDFAEHPDAARKHLERYLQVAGGDDVHVAAAKERLALIDATRPRKKG